ncbi:MAG: peptidoglycan recognition family protein [Armatimonadota bacterium]|nr:peptidoglycan recognition family protein [Armatimonadota bacterium]
MISRRRRRRRQTLRVFLLLAFAAALCWFRYRNIVSEWLRQKPPGIIIHHSASPPRVGGRIIDAKALDRMHAHRGFRMWYEGKIYHIGYHFVVLPDGKVQTGRPVGCRGAHTHGRSIYNRYIGICLVGNFSSTDNSHGQQGPLKPTRAQMNALTGLCGRLMDEYRIDPAHIKRHRDFNRTECPGDRFPYHRLIAELKRRNHAPRVADAGHNHQ